MHTVIYVPPIKSTFFYKFSCLFCSIPHLRKKCVYNRQSIVIQNWIFSNVCFHYFAASSMQNRRKNKNVYLHCLIWKTIYLCWCWHRYRLLRNPLMKSNDFSRFSFVIAFSYNSVNLLHGVENKQFSQYWNRFGHGHVSNLILCDLIGVCNQYL